MFMLARYTLQNVKVTEEPDVKITDASRQVKRRKRVAFSHVCDDSTDDAEALVALNCPKLCEHASTDSTVQQMATLL